MILHAWSGFFRFEAISGIIGNPSTQKPFYPVSTMNALVVLLATFNILIWVHIAVMIARIIGGTI